MTPFAVAIAQSDWLFPTIETVHVLALTLVVGSIAILDLRLLGLSGMGIGVLEIGAEILPRTWVVFVVAAISGALMFTSKATTYYGNIQFLMKLVLLFLAGMNMAIFHATAYREAVRWNYDFPTPISARIAGALSLVFWIGIVILGRWVGFSTK